MDWFVREGSMYTSAMLYCAAVVAAAVCMCTRARVEAALVPTLRSGVGVGAQSNARGTGRPWLRALQLLITSLALRGAWFALTAAGVGGSSSCLSSLACAKGIGVTTVNRTGQMLFFTSFAIIAAQLLRVARVPAPRTQQTGRDPVVAFVDVCVTLLSVWLLVLQLAILSVSLFVSLPLNTATRIYDVYIIMVAVLHALLCGLLVYICVQAHLRLGLIGRAYASASEDVLISAGASHGGGHGMDAHGMGRMTALAQLQHARDLAGYAVQAALSVPARLRPDARTHTHAGQARAHAQDAVQNQVLQIAVPTNPAAYAAAAVSLMLSDQRRASDAEGKGREDRSPAALLTRRANARMADGDDARTPLLAQDFLADERPSPEVAGGDDKRSSTRTRMDAQRVPPEARKLSTQYRELSRQILALRWRISALCLFCTAMFMIRSVMFLWRPVTGTNITGTAGAVMYPWFFYTIVEIAPALVTAVYVGGLPFCLGCRVAGGRCSYAAALVDRSLATRLATDESLDAVTARGVWALLLLASSSRADAALIAALTQQHLDALLALRTEYKQVYACEALRDVHAGTLDSDV